MPQAMLTGRVNPISLLKTSSYSPSPSSPPPHRTQHLVIMADFLYEPCAPTDYDAMADIYCQAFRHSKLHKAMYPIPFEPLRAWFIAKGQKFALQVERHTYKMTEAATGKLVAFIIFAVPYTPSAEEQARREHAHEEDMKREDKGFPVGANTAVCLAFHAAVAAVREKHTNDDMYKVNLLATHPDFQRRGLGRTMLEQVLGLADAEGKYAYIEATEEGHPLYLKLGWEDVDAISFDLGALGAEGTVYNWVQVRKPRKASGN